MKPYWVNYEWQPIDESPMCVCCGVSMGLNEGCDWDEDPDLNLCHDCALKIVRDNKSNIE